MRYLILFLIIITGCQESTKKDNQDNTSKTTKAENTDYIKKTSGFLVGMNNRVNYGKVKIGETIYQDFLFVNKGTEEVEIIAYSPSCNCTSANLEKNLIYVNDSTKFQMVIDTSNKHYGMNEVTTTIETNGKRKFYLLSTKFEIIE